MRDRLIARLLAAVFAALLPVMAAHADGVQAMGEGEILRGRFVQERILQGFNAPLKSEGSFVLAPGQGLIWRAEKPFVSTTMMTEQGLAQQSDGTTTLNLPASRAPFMAGLYDMLSGALAGDWQALERDFVVERSNTGGNWALQLTPKVRATSDAMPIAEIKVAGAAFVEHVEIVKQGGDRDVLTFLDQQRAAAPLTAEEQKMLQTTGQP